MKLNIALVALAALVQAEEPQPDLIDSLSTFITGAAAHLSSINNEIHSAVESRASAFESEHSDAIDSLTSAAGAKLSSLTAAVASAASDVKTELSHLATATGPLIPGLAQPTGTGTKGDAAPAPTAFVALGALVGGAVLANM